MPIFLASFFISLVILGVLTFIGLTAGIGIFSGSKRGGGVQFCCWIAAITYAIFCSIYAGTAALAGVVAAGIAIAVVLFLKERIKP